MARVAILRAAPKGEAQKFVHFGKSESVDHID
jgi:hypothetical protein